MSLNKACIIGNLGADPEIRTFENGNKVANFSVATTEKWKNKDGEPQSATEWHRVAVFGKLADIVEKWVKKGQQVYLEGKIKTRKYDKDGVDVYTTEIVLQGFGDVFQMIGGKSEGTAPAAAAPAAKANQDADTKPQEDDLPF